ncbi:MAG: MFS transporter, partial [Candidatus Eiseniibacteriota bacterium]
MSAGPETGREQRTGRVLPAPFQFLWAAQFLSQFGDSLFQIAFVWLVLDLTGSKAATGVAATVSYLPALLFGVVAGLLVDRWDRRWVMAGADLGRALLMGLAGFLLWKAALNPQALTVIAFAMATSAVLFNPARDSILPEIVPRERLTQANAWVQSSQQAALLFGPLAAGVLIQRAGVGSVFPAGVFLFGGSLLLLLGMRGVGRGHRGAEAPLSLLEDLRRGLRAIAADRILVLLLVLTAFDNLFIMGPAILGNVVIVRETLGGTAADYAIVEAAYGVGMIAGSLFLAKYGHRYPSGLL